MFTRFVLAILWVLLAVIHAQAQTAPPLQQPFLRIEAGMHTAEIWGAGLSGDGKLMVTGSDDKTIRLWSLPDGRLIRTMRVPIGMGKQGDLFSVAFSPDGKTVAAGGWDAAYAAGERTFAYLFDVISGRIVRRFGPMSATINYVAFSKDGMRLAVGLWGSNGIRIWDVQSGQLVGEDDAVNGSINGLTFGSEGRLAATSDDGFLRLYDANSKLIAKIPAVGGKDPLGIAFNRTGNRLAVGYSDTTAVDIFDDQLKWLYAADTKGIDSGNLCSVMWSADGRSLFASGTYMRQANDGQWFDPIIRWSDEGSGRRYELPGPLGTIQNLQPWGPTGIAFGSSDPSFGLVDGTGQPVLVRRQTIADMRWKVGNSFLISGNARQVWFDLADQSDPWILNLASSQFTPSPTAPSNLTPADITGLPVSDWRDTYAPKLAGAALTLSAFERSRSLAVLPDKSGFVLGTEWNLRHFDSNGKQTWQQQNPGIAWGVNASSDGRIVVAAYGDGTIRWHRASDGQELLAFFVEVPEDPKAPKRWVLWTPKGYYTASPGGEDLIGWHVNGKTWDDTPEFYSASHFRDQFYRPDIVKLVLDTLDEDKAIEQANAEAGVKRGTEDIREEAPPTIRILSPSSGEAFHQPTIALKYNARLPNGQRLTDIEVLIDGEKMGSRDIGDEGNLTLNLPPHDVTVTVIGASGTRLSEPATVRLRWDGTRLEEKKRVTLHALLIGESTYQNGIQKLTYPSKDASDLEAAFKAQAGKAYTDVETRLVQNGTRRDIIDGFRWLQKKADVDGVSVIMLAGHGVMDSTHQFYFVPVDADRSDIPATAVSSDELMRTVRNLKGRVVVFLDACHSAEGFNSGAGQLFTPDTTRITNEVTSAENAAVMYAASTGSQLSWEGVDGMQNGVFTRAVIEGLSGKADFDQDGVITTQELALWVNLRVTKLTHNAQIPLNWSSRPVEPYALAAMH